MVLADIKNALLTVTDQVYHFDATGAIGNYIVWSEDGQAGSVWADGRMKEQTITGTIDYFTRTEYDPMINDIQTALDTIGISYRLNSIQYESGANSIQYQNSTKIIHYEWVWEVS